MTANRPQPRPGVLDIAPYVPGKSSAPGVAKVFKLSSNETPLGPSPKAIAAYARSAEHLEDYPDGAATGVARGDRRARSGSIPTRIVCGAGSDDLLNLLARAYLADGDEAIHTTHGFLVYPIATLGTGAKPVVAPEKDYTADVDAILAAVTPQHQDRVPRQPEQSDRHLHAVRRGQAPARGRCRRTCCWCSTRPMPNTSQRNDYEAGIELVATSENVVMTRTFSKIYGLAALRLGWMYGPAHVDRRDQPHPRAVQRQRAGDRGRHRGDRGHRACRARARAQCAMARLADRGDRQARPQGDAERRRISC